MMVRCPLRLPTAYTNAFLTISFFGFRLTATATQKVTVYVHLDRPSEFFRSQEAAYSQDPCFREEKACGKCLNRQPVISSLRPTEWLVDHSLSITPPQSPMRMKNYHSSRSLPPAPIHIDGVGSGRVSNSPFRKQTGAAC